MKNFYEEAKSPDLLCADKKRIIPPKHDVMFKILFGNHKKYLADLLSKILKIENLNEEDITYLNSEQIPDLPGAKSSRMDLSIKVNDELLNIEVQVQNHDSYKDRCLYYWSKLFSGSLNKGSNYKDLKKAIVINFLDFKLFDDKDVFHEVVAVVKDSEQIFSDKFGLFFFELPNLSGTINVDEEILLWLKFLSAESREELKMLKESSNTVIKDAVDDVFATSEEIEAWGKAWARDKAEFDYQMDLTDAHKAGLKEGEAKGIEAERKKWTEKIKKLNLSDEDLDKLLN